MSWPHLKHIAAAAGHDLVNRLGGRPLQVGPRCEHKAGGTPSVCSNTSPPMLGEHLGEDIARDLTAADLAAAS
jgi:hypothetical protein